MLAVWPLIRRFMIFTTWSVLHVVEFDSIGAGFTLSAPSGLWSFLSIVSSQQCRPGDSSCYPIRFDESSGRFDRGAVI